MTAELVVKIALVKSPRLQQMYGELGLARADVLDAVQVANPRLDVSRLGLAGGAGSQVIFGVSAPFVDLVTLPAKSRLARLDYERARLETAAAVFDVTQDVKAAWYGYVAAQQVAATRAAAAEALGASADLSQRFYDAGNITELQLNRERAAASQARIAAALAAVAARGARFDLNALIGLTGRDAGWSSNAVLPLPPEVEDDPVELRRIARETNLKLQAAEKGAEVARGAAGIARRFRLLGATAVGYERERETDRSAIRGPSLSLELPLFNQGGARVARAEAQLQLARARLAELRVASGDAIDLGAERLRTLRDVVDFYRQALVPEREAVARQSQLEQNYALIGEFEVLQARAQEIEAYQGFLEAIRDYWLARVELARLVGSPLPGDQVPRRSSPTLEMLEGRSAGPLEGLGGHGSHHHGSQERPPAGEGAEPGKNPGPRDPAVLGGPPAAPQEHHHHGG